MRHHRLPRRHLPAWTAPLAGALLLAACGGGGQDDTAAPAAAAVAVEGRMRIQAVTLNPGGWVAVTQPNDLLLQNLNIPADAPTRGMWSAVGGWPMNGLHQAVLPDGRVLTWGTTPDGNQQNGRYFDVWDPNRGLFDAGAHATSYDPNRQDSFCSASAWLPNGQLMITGGNGNLTNVLYTPSSGGMVRGANVADARWYATMLTLADGRAIVLGGINPYTEGQYNDVAGALVQGLSSMTPEVYENGAWRSLLNAQSRSAFGPDFLRASMPKAWLAPDGRVFGVSTDQMWYVDANAAGGQGTTTIVGAWKTPPVGNASNDTAPNVGPTATGVMYAPGKVLMLGGNAYHNGSGFPGSRMATSIDLNGGGAVLAEQPRMAFARIFANPVVLPDGKVVVTGGETRANNDPAFGVYAAEIWNPATGTWATMASSTVFRGYHSQSSLLTNGTVLVTGGGTPGPIQLRGDVFYPPYLFRSAGGAAQLAPRPRLVGISGLAYAHGAQMQFDMADGGTVSQVALIGLSVGTHSFNAGQRRIPLQFSQEQFRITTTLPGATLAPPGYYQLVALDANGVPSRGSIIAVGQGVGAPQVPVTPYNPPVVDAVIPAPVITAGGSASYTVPAQSGVSYSWDFGDGSPATAFNTNPSVSKVYANAGVYAVTLTAREAGGATSTRSFLQAVGTVATSGRPVASSAVALETRSGASARLWVANPDHDTVAVIDTATSARVAEIAVGASPRSVAVAPDGRIWVTNKGGSSISILSPTSLSLAATVALPPAAQPHGLVFAPGGSAFVALEATGQLLKLSPSNGAVQGTLAVGANPRHLSASANGATVLVSRFITPPLPGEGTAVVDTAIASAEVLAVNAGALTLNRRIVLRHSDKVDNAIQGAGIPNYLAAAVISPDGRSAWVPSKQDNVKRGVLRNGLGLDFQNSVRAISSRIDMATLAEDGPARVDHDNASLATAAVFHPSGAYLFVALETSRQVAVLDAVRGRELAKFDVGRAPQALALSADGLRLYVQNFMDRSVSVLDLGPLLTRGLLQMPALATVGSAGSERLAAQVLVGKQLFYDARDPRLARDSYMSCASCHADGGHDGRTWDFTGFGEGLRNTPALAGRAGVGQGFQHWSANFDEVQDFEGQIRSFAGGTGLMSDAQFNTGTRSQPLGDRKAGVNADLDALAAYLDSLTAFEKSPWRNATGTLTTAAIAGKAVFVAANCASCHGGAGFTGSADAGALRNIGTLKPSSGQRLGATLAGIDVPTLRDVWKTAPYLHDGSAPTLAAAVQAHAGNTVAGTDLSNLVAYLQQIGADEPAPAVVPGNGTGLQASYFGNTSLSGTAIVTRTELPWFDWGTGAPAPGVAADNFSVRWRGEVQALEGGSYQFRTVSDDGVRVWVNDVLVINNWTAHAPTTDTSAALMLAAGQRVPIVIEYQEFGGGAVLQLSWLRPGGAWAAVPAAQLVPAGATVNPPPPTAAPPAEAATCAAEGGTCTLPTGATASVWYGAGSSWVLRTGVTGAIACTNAVFGDPVPGTVKSCRSLVTTPPPNQAPSVSLGAPASVVQGTAVALTASAADADGSVVRVEFYAGNTLLGSDTTEPYAYSWTGAAVGTYSLTARAVDNAGAATTSATATLTVTAAPATPGGPVGAWSLDEAAGSSAADASANNRPLALSGTSWVAGRLGSALQFNGANASASTATPVLDTAGSFTVSAWVRLDALTGWRTFVNQDGVNVSGFWLQYSEFVGNKFALTMHDADSTASGAFRAVGTTTPVIGRWYHLAGVRDKAAGTMKLYVDGQLEATTAYGGGWSANGRFNVGRGRWGVPNDWLAGAVDEVRAFGRALSDAEVGALFTPAASQNLAPGATLATSYVSPWETLAAVNNAIVPANSADKTGGAYGNWQGEALYGRTEWVSLSWSSARRLDAFEVYWWNDGMGIATPTSARVEYWNGSTWVLLGSPGLALNGFNRLTFTPVTTTSIRVAMASPRATGILEARVWGTAP